MPPEFLSPSTPPLPAGKTDFPIQREEKQHRLRILGSRVDRLNFSQTAQRVFERIHTGECHQLVTANTLMLLEAEQDPELQAILEYASVVVPESWGVAWASRRLQCPLSEYIPGIDLMLSLCKRAALENHSVYLLGAKPGVAKQAAARLQSLFPGLVIMGTRDGYFSPTETPELVDAIRQARPTFLFVGMNVPYQEKWIARHLRDLQVPMAMGVGGSFDVLSGKLKRAPVWIRKLGIEWVYRTLQEPWRIQRIIHLPVFMWRVWKQS